MLIRTRAAAVVAILSCAGHGTRPGKNNAMFLRGTGNSIECIDGCIEGCIEEECTISHSVIVLAAIG